MARGLLCVALIMSLCIAVGCGSRQSALDDREGAKPVDIGSPADWPVGATMYETSTWIVKQDVDGEMRLWALDIRAPGMKQESTKFEPDEGIFYTKGRERSWNADGSAIHTLSRGTRAGEEGNPMRRRFVAIDKKTGHVLLYRFRSVEKTEVDDMDEGAYVLAQ